MADGSGFYRKGVTQYNIVGGPRYSVNYDKWRPFVQAMAGIRHINSFSFVSNPLVIDIGGGADYKLPFRELFLASAGRLHALALSERQPERLPGLNGNCVALLIPAAEP